MKLNNGLINSIANTKLLQKYASSSSVVNTIAKLSNPKNILPIMLLEAVSITGRSKKAHERGGWYEFRERLFEELSASFVWLFGVKTFNKAANLFAKKVWNVDTTIDWKNPLEEFSFKRGDTIRNKLVLAKSAKLLFSISFTIFSLGFVIPKINQWWTRKAIARDYKNHHLKTTPSHNQTQTSENLTNFKSNLQPPLKINLSFKGGLLNGISTLGFLMDHNSIAQVMTGDLGLISTRMYNARNKDESIEILVRNGSSVFFFSFCLHVVSKALAKTFDKTQGVNTLLNIKALEPINVYFLNHIATLSQKYGDHIPFSEIERLIKGVPPETLNKTLHNFGISQHQTEILHKNLQKSFTESAQQLHKKDLQALAQDLKLNLPTILKEFNDYATLQNHTAIQKNLRGIYNIADIIMRPHYKKGDPLTTLTSLAEGLNTLTTETSSQKLKQFLNHAYQQLQYVENIDKNVLTQLKSIALQTASLNLKEKEGLLKSIDGILKDTPLINLKRIADTAHQQITHGTLITDIQLNDLKQTLSKNPHLKLNPDIQKLLTEINVLTSQTPALNLSQTRTILSDKLTGQYSFNKVLKQVNTPLPNPKEWNDTKKLNNLIEESATYLERITDSLHKTFNKEHFSYNEVKSLIKQTRNKHTLLKSLYIVTGLSTAGFFLFYVIPTIQNKITEIRTGQNKFPGVRGLIPQEKTSP